MGPGCKYRCTAWPPPVRMDALAASESETFEEME